MGFTSELLKTVTFQGLSSTPARLIAAGASLVIWVLSVLLLVGLSFRFEAAGIADQIGLAAVSIILVHYSLSGRFLLADIAIWMALRTPVGVLYRNDRKILGKARKVILRLARQHSFASFLPYSNINPAVARADSFEVFKQQEAGTLQSWLDDTKNLNTAAHLVFQIALVEQALAAGDYPRPEF